MSSIVLVLSYMTSLVRNGVLIGKVSVTRKTSYGMAALSGLFKKINYGARKFTSLLPILAVSGGDLLKADFSSLARQAKSLGNFIRRVANLSQRSWGQEKTGKSLCFGLPQSYLRVVQ